MVAENQPGHIDQIKQTNAGAVYRLIDQLGPVSAYSQHISVESTQFSNQGTMAGAALVKDAMYNGSLLIRLLQG